ncbi:MAG TPA: protein translocase subunit SecF [Bryobacterales bacterium]|nr:protein translocase subunit SecF [Bryobacterales bacterium]
MQLLVDTKFDFLGKKLYFIGLSVLLSLAGILSLIVKHGPRYGIDFRGGALVLVKFQEAPPLDRLRKALDEAGLKGSTLQPYDKPEAHEVLIGLEIADEKALNSRRAAIIQALQSAFGAEPNKLDFNTAGVQSLAERLRNSPYVARSSMTSEQVDKLAQTLLDYRNTPPRSGLVKNFDELRSLPGVNPDIISALKSETYLGQFTVPGVQVVGPKVGKDLQWQAIKATLLALAGMLVYIWFRFEWIYGAAAVIAVFHDTIITIGLFSLFNKEISLTVIAALLTLVGYSMNDTIVIFDRIRENLKLMRKTALEPLINVSVNQTLSRTVLTSGLTFLTVLSLYLFGGEVLNGFSFALVVGIIIGTYSSVFVASPILIWYQGVVDRRKAIRGPVLVDKAANRRKVAGR